LKGKRQPRTLDEILPYVDEILESGDQSVQRDLITGLLDFIGAPEEFRTRIFDRWLKLKMPGVREFSPYAHYCLRTLLIFQAGLAFGLLSTRGTNRIDLEYLLYAHFGYVFCSNDKFHRVIFPCVHGGLPNVRGSSRFEKGFEVAERRVERPYRS